MRCLKKTVTLVLALLMTVMSFSFGAISVSAAGWDGTTATAPEGTGTMADPFKIASAENLAWLGAAVEDPTLYEQIKGKYFLQTADIDLNGQTMNAIGSKYNMLGGVGTFSGVYDGGNFTITNGTFKAQLPEGYNIRNDYKDGKDPNVCGYGAGLFGAAINAIVRNVKMVNMQIGPFTPDDTYTAANDVFGAVFAGAIVGCGRQVQVENCSTDSLTVVGGFMASGGIVGWLTLGSIIGCTNEARVLADQCTGGIVGRAGGMTITHCVNKGIVNPYRIHQSNSFSGGICGYIDSTDDVEVNFYYCVQEAPEVNMQIVKDRTLRNYGYMYYGGIFSNRPDSGRTQIIMQNCYNLTAKINITEYMHCTFRYYTAGLTGRPSGHTEAAATLYDGCFSVNVYQSLTNLFVGADGTPVKETGYGMTDMPCDHNRNYKDVDIASFVASTHKADWSGIMAVGSGIKGIDFCESSVNMTDPEKALCQMINGSKYGATADEIKAMDGYKAIYTPLKDQADDVKAYLQALRDEQEDAISPITQIKFVGIQKQAVKDNGQYNIRLMLTVDDLAYYNLGFDVTVSYKTQTTVDGEVKENTVTKKMNLSTMMVLEQYYANGALKNASDLGMPYVGALELNSPLNTRFGETTVTVIPYFTINGRTRYDAKWEMVFSATGELTTMAPAIG